MINKLEKFVDLRLNAIQALLTRYYSEKKDSGVSVEDAITLRARKTELLAVKQEIHRIGKTATKKTRTTTAAKSNSNRR